MVASSEEKKLCFWDLDGYRKITDFIVKGSLLLHLQFHPTDLKRILLLVQASEISLFDCMTVTPVVSYKANNITAGCFSLKGTYVFCGTKGRVVVLNTLKLEKIKTVQVSEFTGRNRPSVTSISCYPCDDNSCLVGLSDGQVCSYRVM